ncbi:hypothetical protein V6N13_049374 [Hibiscus sabdariffa]
MSGSETGMVTNREPFSLSMQQKSPVASQPVIQNMRLAFSTDGTAVYKPFASASPTYQPASGGGETERSAGGPAVTQGQGQALNMSMGNEPLKRKRGRPRKYGLESTMPLTVISPPPVSVTQSNSGGGFPSPTHPPPPSGGSASSTKKARGRPPGSVNKPKLYALGSGRVGFTPHVITVKVGEDVSSKIMSFSQHGPRAICILSANGAISNVTLCQPATSGGTVTYEGRFEILSLSGSFLLSENGGQRSRTGGLSVSLSGPDGRVLGGGVAGLLTAASPVQVVVGSFITDNRKETKPAYQMEALSAPPKLAPGVTSSPSHGTLSETSGGPGSPVNQSMGACNINNNGNPQGMSNFPWNKVSGRVILMIMMFLYLRLAWINVLLFVSVTVLTIFSQLTMNPGSSVFPFVKPINQSRSLPQPQYNNTSNACAMPHFSLPSAKVCQNHRLA